MVSLLGNKKYDLTVIIEYFHKNKSIENIIKIFFSFHKKNIFNKIKSKTCKVSSKVITSY